MSEHTPPAESGSTAGTPESTVGDTVPPGESGSTAGTPESTVGDTVRFLVVAASIGAAVIHFAYTPVHFTENTVHVVFFLFVAWAQLGTAFAIARWRESRWPWVAAAALNAAVIAIWFVSRTAGVPGSDPEPFGFPDALASGLEAIAVAGSLVALRPTVLQRPAPRLNPVVGGVVALAVVGLVSASVTPSIAGEHGHDNAATGGGDAHDMAGMEGMDHGHDGGAAASAVDRSSRCDLGFNTASFNDDAKPGAPHTHGEVSFTIDEFAKVFYNPDTGMTAAGLAKSIKDSPGFEGTILSGSITHSLGPDPWNPLTSETDCAKLAKQLDQAKAVAATYPTVKDAEAAGYHMVTNYVPGIAAHYMNFGYLTDGFVLEHPEMLLYDGTEPTSHVVGLSYYILQGGDTEPASGFAGDNDHYHRHIGLCVRAGVVIGSPATSKEDCEAQGGTKGSGADGWMSHAWVVPGCESDWGVFSGANPVLKVGGPGSGGPAKSGCGTGKTMSDALDFDTSGGGPSVEVASGK
jgi:hypothetical protein